MARVATAQPSGAQETGETTAVSYDESVTEFGRLHLAAQVLGYQYSKPAAGLVATLSVVFELRPRFFLTARATLPIYGLNTNNAAPRRLEAGVVLVFKNQLQVEMDHVTLKQTQKDHIDYDTFVNVPHANRSRAALEAAILAVHGGARFTDVTGAVVDTQTMALVAAVGINAMDTHGYVTSVEKYGKLRSFLWTTGGLDFLYDLTRTYDVEPTDKGRKYGGRIWGETMFGRHVGVATRLELGKYPGQMGWMFLASVGGSLHAL